MWFAAALIIVVLGNFGYSRLSETVIYKPRQACEAFHLPYS